MKLKETIDTAAVMLGNLLRICPTGWGASETQAREMRRLVERHDGKSTVLVLDVNEKELVVVKPMTPLAYLLDSVIIAFLMALAIYTGYYLIVEAMYALAALVGFVIAGLLFISKSEQ